MTTIRNAPGGAAGTAQAGDSWPISRSPYNNPATTNFYMTPVGLLAYLGATTSAAVTTTDPTVTVNTLHYLDLSGLTADRTFTLPGTAAVGDTVGLFVSTGDDAFELLITATAGDTLNGVAGGTEWSRVFITNEYVSMRCVVANTTWLVDYDGRIPQRWMMRLSTAASAEVANTFTQPTAKGGAWTADIDNASLTTVSTDRGKTRRAGTFIAMVKAEAAVVLTDANFYGAALGINGTSSFVLLPNQIVGGISQVPRVSETTELPLVVDDFLVFVFRSQEGSRGLQSAAAPQLRSAFSLVEILP